MRKRTIKFIISTLFIVVLGLAPIIAYGLTFINERQEPFGRNQTDYELVSLDVGDSFNGDTLLYVPYFMSGAGTIYDLTLISNNSLIRFQVWWAGQPYMSIKNVASDTFYFYHGISFTDGYYSFTFNSISSDFIEQTFIVDSINRYPDNQFDVKFPFPIITYSDSYSFESFMVDYMNIIDINTENVIYSVFNSFIGESSIFGLAIFSRGAILYLTYLAMLEITSLIFEFLLFIPKLCRKWLCAFTGQDK